MLHVEFDAHGSNSKPWTWSALHSCLTYIPDYQDYCGVTLVDSHANLSTWSERSVAELGVVEGRTGGSSSAAPASSEVLLVLGSRFTFLFI